QENGGIAGVEQLRLPVQAHVRVVVRAELVYVCAVGRRQAVYTGVVQDAAALPTPIDGTGEAVERIRREQVHPPFRGAVPADVVVLSAAQTRRRRVLEQAPAERPETEVARAARQLVGDPEIVAAVRIHIQVAILPAHIDDRAVRIPIYRRAKA